MEQKNDVLRGIRFLKEDGQPDAAKIAQEARARATRCKNLTATGKDNTFSSWTDSDWFKCCYSEVVAQAEGEQAIWLQRMGFTTKVSAAEARELSTDGRL